MDNEIRKRTNEQNGRFNKDRTHKKEPNSRAEVYSEQNKNCN